MRSVLRRANVGLVISLFLASAIMLFSASNVSAAGFAFTNFELGDFNPPGSPGTVCPQSTENQACTNYASEPAIRANPAGNFYASSEHGLGGGTDAWRSSDGGHHYVTLVSPNAGSQANNTGFAPGGGDTDLATAPVKNSAGNYNVYVSSLNLANVDVSTSTDNGTTWTLNPTSATIHVDDREWIAADGASKVCISYHDIGTGNINVNCSMDAGATFTQLGEAIDSNHSFALNAVGGNMIGNLMIDPNNHNIYQTFSSVDNGDTTACTVPNTGPCSPHVVYMAVSTDCGKTFTDYTLYDNPNIYYSYAKNNGRTWSAPVQVNSGSSATAIFPWSVANNAGHIDIVWYGTSFYDGVNPPDNYPMTASWFVYFAQNLNANSSGSAFIQVTATPIVHFGGVCESGVTCSGNRDLFDDFGVAASPLTGLASIVYSDDQYTNDVNDPPQSGCTPSTSNSGSCDHTSISTQTGGPGI